MRLSYDFHIHSGLSPCADKDMTPVDIVGYAKLSGLDAVAVADHNSILNVGVAMTAGEAYGVNVVPAFELQTQEDIHLLCLFETFENLSGYFKSISFSKRKNRADIFGNQYVFDEDDNVVGEVQTMLLDSAKISTDEAAALALKFGGVAVPAHIDREANSMLQILGAITKNFGAVELSTKASAEEIELWRQTHRVLVDSDAHTLSDIGLTSKMELSENTPRAIIKYLLGDK